MNRRVPGSMAFAAIILTGMALIAPAAHLLALPNKIRMEATDYFVVQRVYNGWWLVGLLLPAALVANVALAVAQRYDGTALKLAVLAAALIALDLAIFFVWTQPANTATANRTIRPEDWLSLRQQWEYSHAINAGIMFIAFYATAAASLRGKAIAHEALRAVADRYGMHNRLRRRAAQMPKPTLNAFEDCLAATMGQH